MSHFAKVVDSKVTQVIVAEKEFFDTFVDSSPGTWIQTSYNGRIRKNYAGVGYTYDETLDAFIAPKPYNSWVLDTDKAQWKAPVDYPTDEGRYTWNEETLTWDVVNEQL